MKRFIWTIRAPLIAELINSVLAHVIGTEYGVFAFPVVTAGIAMWAGALISKEPWGSLAHGAWAGPAILFWGVLLAAGYIAIAGPLGVDELKDLPERTRNTWVLENPRLAVLLGFAVSSAMFMPVAALISLFGGYLAKRGKEVSQ